MDPRIIKYCLEKGCLIDKDVSEILDNLGNIEIAKEKIETQPLVVNSEELSKTKYGYTKNKTKVIYSYPGMEKKVEVEDFVKNFRARFNSIKNILQNRSELENLISINKIGQKKQ